MIKYLLNKTDIAQPIYEVDYKNLTYKLISQRGDVVTKSIGGKFKEGGFKPWLGGPWVEVKKPERLQDYQDVKFKKHG